jgi:acyl-CoA thioesterase FadM
VSRSETSPLTILAVWNVPPDEIDHIDHMGTAFYAYRAEQGALRLIERLTGLTGLVADRHIHYRREQRLGAPLRLSAGVTGASGPRVAIYAEITNAETGQPAAEFNLQIELRAQLEHPAFLQITPPARSRPRSLPYEKLAPHLRLADFARVGIASHSRQEIDAAACDADGFLKTTKPRFIPDDHVPTTGVMAGVWNYAPGYFWPAVEQRDLRFRLPRRGDILETYEAVLGVAGKAVHSANWIFEATSGDLIDARHMITVYFDSRTRRSQNLPPDLLLYLNDVARPELLG